MPADWGNDSTLANYMFLMQTGNYSVPPKEEMVLVKMTLTGCGLSVVGNMLTIFLVCFVPARSDGLFSVSNQAFAMLTAQLAFIGAENTFPYQIMCKLATAILHYFFLTVHFWSLAYGIHLLMKMRGVLQTSRGRRRYILVIIGWFLPFLVMACTAVIRGDVYGNEKLCWLSSRFGTRYAFVGPVSAIMTFNMAVVVLMLVTRLALDAKKAVPMQKRIKHVLMTLASLVPVLSLTWVFGLSPANSPAQYLFVALNSAQGLLIFFGHMLCSSVIRHFLVTKVKGPGEGVPPPPREPSSNTSESVLFKDDVERAKA